MAKNRRWETPDPDYSTEFLDFGDLVIESSPRDTLGHLKLVQNSHYRNVGKVIHTRRVGGFVGLLRGASWNLKSLDSGLYNSHYSKLYNTAYAKLRGKLYYGSASLGMTIASYKQSSGMIRKRYQQMARPLDGMLAEWATSPRHARRLADTHLEVVFGWQPLLEDIQKAATSVIQHADVSTHIKGKQRSPVIVKDNPPLGTSLRYQREFDLHMSVCASATVLIRNENAWLLERAGLLNPAAVAWDLVPWSFVVNMFANTSAIVNSLTDFVGLEFSDVGVTTSVKGLYFTRHGWASSYGERQFYNSYKERTLGPLARPSLQFRLPDVNMGLAGIAASLFTQKFNRLSRFISKARQS